MAALSAGREACHFEDRRRPLDVIEREADKADASRHYIKGAVMQAKSLATSRMTRNRDGYLVVEDKSEMAVQS